MTILSGPNWLGSPQHVIGGLVAAAVVVVAAQRGGAGTLLAVALAIGAASTAEIVVELVEYPVTYADHLHATAYYDTIADLGSTLAGAVAGALVAAYGGRLRLRP